MIILKIIWLIRRRVSRNCLFSLMATMRNGINCQLMNFGFEFSSCGFGVEGNIKLYIKKVILEQL